MITILVFIWLEVILVVVLAAAARIAQHIFARRYRRRQLHVMRQDHELFERQAKHGV